MNEQTEIGVILKPQGLKGELKIKPISDNLKHFLEIKYVYLLDNSEKIDIVNARIQNGFAYLQLQGINSVEEAENLRNKSILIDKTQLPKLDENEFFIEDLLTCVVKNENGIEIGKICDIDNYGSGDIITILSSEANKKIQFPFLNCVVEKIDVENKIMIVKEKEFNEVRLDED